MQYCYENLLDADLYLEHEFTAKFIDRLTDSETTTISEQKAEEFIKHNVMPCDDMVCASDDLLLLAENIVNELKTLPPEFFIYDSPMHYIRLKCDIPRTKEQTHEFITAAKAIAFVKLGQCIFFRTFQPLYNNKPVFGNDITNESDWSIFILGSSIYGICHIKIVKTQLEKDKFNFIKVDDRLIKEGEYPYPYNRFFFISGPEEMLDIIKKLPKISTSINLTEEQMVINFATTLKLLSHFKYLKNMNQSI